MPDDPTIALFAQAPPVVHDESNAQRLMRIRGLVSIDATLDPADAKWLLAIFLEQSNAITWGTNCLNCSHMLDQCYAETVRREEMEAEFEAGGIANAKCQAHLERVEADLTDVRSRLANARSAKAFYPTDFNVRRSGNRLTAYTDDQGDAPEVGQQIIVGTSEPGGIATLARVHSVEELAPRGDRTKPIWAIVVDWLPEHWS